MSAHNVVDMDLFREDRPVSPGQREYLRAFEAWLRDPSEANLDARAGALSAITGALRGAARRSA